MDNIQIMQAIKGFVWRTRPYDAPGAMFEWLHTSFDAADLKGNMVAKHGKTITGCRITYGVYSESGSRRGIETIMAADVSAWSAPSRQADPAAAAEVGARAAQAAKPMTAIQEIEASGGLKSTTTNPFATAEFP